MPVSMPFAWVSKTPKIQNINLWEYETFGKCPGNDMNFFSNDVTDNSQNKQLYLKSLFNIQKLQVPDVQRCVYMEILTFLLLVYFQFSFTNFCILQNSLLAPIVAGSCASVFQTTISYPFEFLKTGLQLHRSLPNAHPFNMMHQFKYYFSGCAALNVGTLFKTVTRFTTFEKACQLLKDPSSPSAFISGPRLLMAGAITGFMESLWVVPFENIKTTMVENALVLSGRFQKEIEDKGKAETGSKREIRATFYKQTPGISPRERLFLHYEEHPTSRFFSTIKEIYLTRGFRGFVQGTAPTIFRQMGNSAVRFTTYTSLKQLISPNKPLNEYYAFVLGFISSCAVVAVTQPIDVIKTRMQSKYAWANYKNSLNCAYRIFVEEGIPKFWKGWAPRLMKVGLSGGVSFGVYQYVENLIKLMAHEKQLGHE